MEEPISRRAEERASCWHVPHDMGSHAVSCRGPRQIVCHSIFVPGLFLGGTTRPDENTALQTSRESRPVKSPAEAPTGGGGSQASDVAVRRCYSSSLRARSTGATFASPRGLQSRNMTALVACEHTIAPTVFLTPPSPASLLADSPRGAPAVFSYFPGMRTHEIF